MKRFAPPALALFGGFLVALSMPPWGFWPLAFVGIICFELSLGEFPTAGQRATRGFVFAVAWMSMGMGWMWFLTAPGYVIAVAFFAALHALAALVAPTGPWRVIGRPAAHTLAEAVRLAFPFGGVPLATLPIGQAGGPLLGVVRFGGVVLLTWVVFQIGFALARLRRGGMAQAHGALAFAVVLLVVLVSVFAPNGRPTGDGRTLRIAIVQGGGEQGTRAVNTDPRLVFERHLDATRTLQPGDAEMVLWPENVIDVTRFVGSVELTEVAAEAARLDAPMVVGITEDVELVEGTDRFLNAQVVVSPEGEVVSRYDKVRRVPFGEYMPMRSLLKALGAPTDLVPKDAVAGTGPAVLELPDGTRLGTVISWEVFFGDRGRDGIRNGGELIVNPTNGSSYTGTVLQTQQVASSRLRAVEHGRWVAQAAPTGFSAFISPTGQVQQRTAVSEQKVIVGDVQLSTGRTWYSYLGDWPFALAALMVLGVSIVAARRRRLGAKAAGGHEGSQLA